MDQLLPFALFAFVASITMKQTIHQTYSLVGPEVLSMAELVRFAALKAQTTTRVIPMPAIVGYLQALMFEFLPVPTLMSPMTGAPST